MSEPRWKKTISLIVNCFFHVYFKNKLADFIFLASENGILIGDSTLLKRMKWPTVTREHII